MRLTSLYRGSDWWWQHTCTVLSQWWVANLESLTNSSTARRWYCLPSNQAYRHYPTLRRPTLVLGTGGPAAQHHGLGAAAVSGLPRIRARRLPGAAIYAEDLAALAVAAGSQSENTVADAAGPDTFTFEELLRLLASAVNARVRLAHTPPSLGFALARPVGVMLRDVVLTRDEVDGLMAGLLISQAAPAGTTRLAGWLEENPDILGRKYVSELRRNHRR